MLHFKFKMTTQDSRKTTDFTEDTDRGTSLAIWGKFISPSGLLRIKIIAAFLWLSQPLWAGPMEEAKALLEQKKYTEVDIVLKPLLDQQEPPTEALEASYSASMACGRYITAYLRLSALLRPKPQDTELHYRAIECASMAGLREESLDHTLSFLTLQKADDDPRVKESLASLLYHRPVNASLLDRTCRLDKKAAWEAGFRQISLARSALKGQLVIDCGRVLLEHYTEQHQVKAVQWAIHDCAREMIVDNRDWLEAIKDLPNAFRSDTVRVFMDGGYVNNQPDKAQLALKHVERFLTIAENMAKEDLDWTPWGDWQMEMLGHVPENERLAPAKRYLALIPSARKLGFPAFARHLHALRHRHNFINNSGTAATAAELQPLFEAMLAMPEARDSRGPYRDGLRSFYEGWLDEPKRLDFIGKHLFAIEDDPIAWWAEKTGQNDREGVIAQALTDAMDQALLRRRMGLAPKDGGGAAAEAAFKQIERFGDGQAAEAMGIVKTALDQLAAPLDPKLGDVFIRYDDLLRKHIEITRGNRDHIAQTAEMWAPKIGQSWRWDELTEHLFNHNRRDVLAKIWPHLKTTLDNGYKRSRAVRNMSRMDVPQETSSHPLLPYFDRLELLDYIDLLMSFRTDGYRRFIVPFLAAGNGKYPFEKWGTYREREQDGWNHVNDLWNDIRHHAWSIDKDAKVPKPIVDAFMTFFLDFRGDANMYSWTIALKIRTEGKDVIGPILTDVMARPLEQRLNILMYLLDRQNDVREQIDLVEALTPHLIKTFNDPGFAESGMSVRLDALRWPVEQTDLRFKELKDAIVGGIANLMDGRGSVHAGHWDHQLFVMREVANHAIEQKRWRVATRSLLAMAGAPGEDRPESGQRVIEFIKAPIDQLMAQDAREPVVAALRRLQKRSGMAEGQKSWVTGQMAAAGRGLQGLFPVEENDPTYDLYVAAEALNAGRLEVAWAKTRPKIDLVMEHWQKLDPAYVVWCAEKLRQFQDSTQAAILCRHLLANEMDLEAGLAAEVFLTKADIFRDQKNFDLARVEYASLKNNLRYAQTEAGRKAGFRLIDLLLLTNNFGAAEPVIERMTVSDRLLDQAQAYYYRARILYLQKDYKAAWDELQNCFKRKFDHTEGQLLLGELKVELKRDFEDNRIFVTAPTELEKITPGRSLHLRLRDSNRVAGAGGSTIPVEVVTSKGKDREVVHLLPSGSDPTLFMADLPTRLGVALPGSNYLEIFGDEVVSYQLDPEFRKERRLPEYPVHHLEVVDDARLFASAGLILTPEEQEKRDMEVSLEALGDRTLRERMSSGRTVRPGSPIYIQVRDRDRNITDRPDKVTVNLKTSSGDFVQDMELDETGPTTGLFRGQCPTDVSLPRCSASDSEPGSDPSFLINSSVEKGWASLADSKPGKWLEVDTQGSHVLQEAVLETADARNMKRVSLLGMLADEWVRLAAYPADQAAQSGGCTEQLVENRAEHERRLQLLSIQVGASKPVQRTGPHHDRNETPLKGRDGWLVGRVQGYFYLKEATKLEFKFLQSPSPHDWQWVYLYIDGEEVLAGHVDGNTIGRSRTILLAKGVHSLDYTFRDHHKDSKIIVGVRSGAEEFVPMPDDGFSLEKNPELADAVKPRADLKLAGTAVKADFHTKDRWRKLKWVFDEYEGTAIRASRITIKDADGKTLVPGPNDYSSATGNRKLEVSPGDQITITYRDLLNLAKGDRTVETDLNASFANGSVAIVEEVMRTDREGHVHIALARAYRYNAGKPFAILVEDADLDLSSQADMVDLQIRTSSGQTLKVSALEQQDRHLKSEHVHTGRFLAVIKTGPSTDPQKSLLGVQEGDTISVSYIDRENTDPGIPFERTAKVVTASGQSARLQPYSTILIQEEDTSQQAIGKLEMMRRRGVDIARLKLMKDVVVARLPDAQDPAAGPIRVSAGAPFIFEILYPAAAVHEQSTITAQVCSHSEIAAAKAENREPRWAESTLALGRYPAGAGGEIRLMAPSRTADEWMLDGVFGGRVELQVGAPGAEPKRILLNNRSLQEGEKPLPVVVVSGADKVVLRFTPEGGESVETEVDVVSEGRLELLDRTFSAQSPSIHLGDTFYLQAVDFDQDKGDELDRIQVAVKVDNGASATVELTETLPHSGIFTGRIAPTWKAPAAAAAASDTPAAEGDTKASAAQLTGATLPVDFGATVRFTYQDPVTAEGKPKDIVAEGAIYFGDNADLAAFSKRFADPEMAVKVRFLWAEALFEQAKSYRDLKKPDVAQGKILEGEQILTEALRDYPDTKLKDQGAFLLANLNQELAKDEPDQQKKTELLETAIVQFSNILTQWPDGEFAPRSQFKKALCLEMMGNFDRAAPEYVRLTYTWPDHKLVSDATLRLGNHYYKSEQFKVAGRIFRNFSKLHPDHELASKTLFLAGQCYMRQAEAESASPNANVKAGAARQWEKALEAFQLVVDNYPDHKEVRPEAMYWSGEVSFKIGDHKNSYRNLVKLTLDYPETVWAKRARGYLTDSAFAKMGED